MAEDAATPPARQDSPDDLAAEGGSYEVIRTRLIAQARDLNTRARALNEARIREFGGTELTVIGSERVRTENNCVPRDMVQVGGRLLFGYKVFIGLKTETAVEDVFSIHNFQVGPNGVDLSAVPLREGGEGLLVDSRFVDHFKELYRFYKEARLAQLTRNETQLLAVFQIGAEPTDVRVLRWAIDARGAATYVDNRGERDYKLPPQHDFEWRVTTREDHVAGAYPHVSIADRVFVETTGGDLTIKIENNTESGAGIYAEPVAERDQTLDDADFHYAEIGPLVLLKIRPYREEKWRYFVFCSRSRRAVRIDAIGRACISLPEDHGIIFPGGYFLQDGQYKVFDGDFEDFEFLKSIRSPNGEDVLYVFHHRGDGAYVLFPYNMIRREVQTPIQCNGYSLFDDGKMVVFRAGEEPTRVHPMQVWQTPFVSAEHAAATPVQDSTLGRLGNAELVRGISDCLSFSRFIEEQAPSRQTYEDLIANVTRALDAYFWLGSADVGNIRGVLEEIRKTAELIVDEFEKVLAIRKQAEHALAEAVVAQRELLRGIRPDDWHEVNDFMLALGRLRTQRGRIITLRDVRYIDLAQLEVLEREVVEAFDMVSERTVAFLLREDALTPLTSQLETLLVTGEKAAKTSELNPVREELARVADGLGVLSEIAAGLQVDDPEARTRILEQIGEVFAHQNRVRAVLENRRRELLLAEGKAEFSAQFKLFSQSVQSAIALADSPEKCEEQLARLMVSFEELEAKFSEFDDFLVDLANKRDEVHDAFNQKRQQLLDERDRRVQNLWAAAERILQGVGRRAASFTTVDELNAYFASDAMIAKARELAERIAEQGSSVKADEVQSRIKSARQDALRGLRDRLELFEGGANVIKFGRHRFSVNTQALDLSILEQGGTMVLSLSGTDFVEPIDDAEFLATRDYWSQQWVSETEEVYRGEYLSAALLFDAEAHREGLSLPLLKEAQRDGTLLAVVRKYAESRYQEGYERGIHDSDASLVLDKILTLHESAGLLRFSPSARALACLFWAECREDLRDSWLRRARSLGRLREAFGRAPAAEALAQELAVAIARFVESTGLDIPASHAPTSGRYLVEELARENLRFTTSKEAQDLVDALWRHLERESGSRRALEDDLRALGDRLAPRFSLARAWLEALVQHGGDSAIAGLEYVCTESAVLLVTERKLQREQNASLTSARVEGLLGQHGRIRERSIALRIDEFLERLGKFKHERVPGYLHYREVRHRVIERERLRLRVDEYKPRVLTSFVRNRLINDVYLPLIGDNLAKQLGAAGEGKRTDLMGLLLLVSPPGYGKTTLMEYVASRLGLAFVKVNGPALGHGVKSLDPQEAPNATARQEVEKINLALEMGNNVMLYLDDIQHTHSELLQKFISLCDAQRRIEGVWKGRTRTYDLRGKKFCVVMAGNPYTESGEKFQIPDMLANRADTYNLGDILSGREDLFALSYIENAITSNPILAPLATRDSADLYRIVEMAQGKEIPTTDLSHGYSAVELAEMKAVLERMFAVQQVLLRVNLEYIRSASMDDKFRTEPRFQLQGSYRNMNKLAEKIVPAMNEQEISALVDDHYVGESQTLTSGAEANLLKFAELRGTLIGEAAERWAQIKKDFARIKLMGGGDDDPVARVTGQLVGLTEQLGSMERTMRDNAGLAERLQGIEKAVEIAATRFAERRPGAASDGNGADRDKLLVKYLQHVEQALQALTTPKLEVLVHNQPPPGIEELLAQQVAIIERTLVPLVRVTNQNLGNPTALDQHVVELISLLRRVDQSLREQRRIPAV